MEIDRVKLNVFLRCSLVGLAYAVSSALVAALLGPMSRLGPSVGNFVIWLFTGTLVSLAFSPFVRNSVGSRQGTVFAAWSVLVLVRSLGLGVEGALFKPTTATAAVVGALFGVLVSLLVAWLLVRLLMPADRSFESRGVSKSRWGWAWRILAVGFSYFVFYFVFGATNALLYTQSFYANNPQYGLSLPPPATIFLAQLIRGPLFGLAALLIIRTVQVPRRRLATWLGFLFFTVGGVAPYVEVTFFTMPMGFNLATLMEVFLQNFLTGVVATYLYVSKSN